MHDRHMAPASRAEGPSWRRLAPGLAVGLVLAGGSALSLMHLAARWQEQEPIRAEAARNAAERRAQEAADRLQPPPVAVPVPPSETYVGGDANTYRAVQWLSEPTYRVSSSDLAPGFRGRKLEVEFRCTAGLDGRLHDCTPTERPAGSGLGRVVLPQLDQVRLRPMQVGTELVEVEVGFGLTFDFRPVPGSGTASMPIPIPLAEAAAPPSEPVTDPDPVETDPAG